MIKGTLIPIGGNEDKGLEINELYSLEFITEGILSHVVREAGGKDAKIIIIPTASSIPDEVSENYLSAFGTLGCQNVEVLDIRKKEDSETARAISLVKNANCLMFSGGDQSKIVDKIWGTTIYDILKQRFIEEEGFVIAGTSAGAMAMSKEMIAGGSSEESFVKGAVIMREGLDLISHVIFDTHFVRRGRFGRISEAIAKHPDLLGIGLSEDTGLIIKEGYNATVIGSGMAIVFDGSEIIHNNEKILEPGTPMTLTHMKVHVLSNGDSFDILEREVTVLPLEKPFI